MAPDASYGTSAPLAGGKRLRADARRNRQRVLEAAEAAFAAEGISVPIDEIARRAGVGPGTVYRHFPTKEALFAAIVLGRIDRLVEEARARLEGLDPGAAFFDFLARLGEEGRAKRDLVEVLAASGLDLDGAHSAVTRELRDAMAILLTRAQAAGAVRDDVEIEDVISLLAGVSLALRTPSSDAGSVDRMLAIVCDGLRC